MASPEKRLENLLFVVSGKYRVYGLREDGSDTAVDIAGPGTMLGHLNFVDREYHGYYVEALTEVLCAALPIERNRAVLEKDYVFLNYLLRSLATVMQQQTLIGHPGQPVEEKLLMYLRDIQEDHTLESVKAGVHMVQCSRRQLQRILRKLCDDGRLIRLSKGRYRLAETCEEGFVFPQNRLY